MRHQRLGRFQTGFEFGDLAAGQLGGIGKLHRLGAVIPDGLGDGIARRTLPDAFMSRAFHRLIEGVQGGLGAFADLIPRGSEVVDSGDVDLVDLLAQLCGRRRIEVVAAIHRTRSVVTVKSDAIGGTANTISLLVVLGLHRGRIDARFPFLARDPIGQTSEHRGTEITCAPLEHAESHGSTAHRSQHQRHSVRHPHPLDPSRGPYHIKRYPHRRASNSPSAGPLRSTAPKRAPGLQPNRTVLPGRRGDQETPRGRGVPSRFIREKRLPLRSRRLRRPSHSGTGNRPSGSTPSTPDLPPQCYLESQRKPAPAPAPPTASSGRRVQPPHQTRTRTTFDFRVSESSTQRVRWSVDM